MLSSIIRSYRTADDYSCVARGNRRKSPPAAAKHCKISHVSGRLVSSAVCTNTSEDLTAAQLIKLLSQSLIEVKELKRLAPFWIRVLQFAIRFLVRVWWKNLPLLLGDCAI